MVEPAFFLTPEPVLFVSYYINFLHVTETANSNACRSQAGSIMGGVYLHLKLTELPVCLRRILLFYTPFLLKQIAFAVYLSLLLIEN